MTILSSASTNRQSLRSHRSSDSHGDSRSAKCRISRKPSGCCSAFLQSLALPYPCIDRDDRFLRTPSANHSVRALPNASFDATFFGHQPHARYQRSIHARLPAAPIAKSRATHAVFTAQFRNQNQLLACFIVRIISAFINRFWFYRRFPLHRLAATVAKDYVSRSC